MRACGWVNGSIASASLRGPPPDPPSADCLGATARALFDFLLPPPHPAADEGGAGLGPDLDAEAPVPVARPARSPTNALGAALRGGGSGSGSDVEIAEAAAAAAEGLLVCEACPALALPVPLLTATAGVSHPPPPSPVARLSPTSVVGGVGGAHRAQHSAEALHYLATQLQRVYEAGVQAGWFDARFDRGPRRLLPQPQRQPQRIVGGVVVACVETHAVRRLSTQYLGLPEADGWNVVAGAIELARIYALNGTTIYHPTVNALDRATRMRLAACLTVSWKFARAAPGHFRRPFTDPEGNGHTLELAVLHAAFLTRLELDALGEWPRDVDLWQQMQELAMDSEVALLLTLSPFSALTDNPLCAAERALEELHEHCIPGVASKEELVQLRALLPFFLRITLDAEHGVYERETLGAAGAEVFGSALVACALAARLTTVVPGPSYRDVARAALARLRGLFEPAEYTLAAEIVAVGSALAGRGPRWSKVNDRHGLRDYELLSPWSGCYDDPSWVLYSCISRPRIRALHAAFLA